jgi:APA family basic amino acid/polyamine antiporter
LHSPEKRGALTLLSGIGLVVADMAGVGVLTTTGFMVREQTPTRILLAWLVGGLVALCGATAYGAISRVIARSGGEYRYLSDLLHPAAGYLAGWVSFLVGFSAPVAMAAFAAGAFAETVVPALDPRLTGALLVILIAVLQAVGARASVRTQNILVIVKLTLLVGFVVLGLVAGSNGLQAWPHAEAVPGDVANKALLVSLVYIAFSYSGWNAAIYASEEFANPVRDVPRAMRYGTLLVAGLYLLVNYVFVCNLDPQRMMQWSLGDTQRVTLAHLVASDWLGQGGAALMSAVVVLVLSSSISAMTLTGPRVYAAMATDGLLPRAYIAKEGKPPRIALLTQTLIVLALIVSQSFESLMKNVGAILTFSTMLTAIAVFVVKARSKEAGPSAIALVAAGIYGLSSAGVLYFTLSSSLTTVWWFLGISVIVCAAYFVQARSPNVISR